MADDLSDDHRLGDVAACGVKIDRPVEGLYGVQVVQCGADLALVLGIISRAEAQL